MTSERHLLTAHCARSPILNVNLKQSKVFTLVLVFFTIQLLSRVPSKLPTELLGISYGWLYLFTYLVKIVPDKLRAFVSGMCWWEFCWRNLILEGILWVRWSALTSIGEHHLIPGGSERIGRWNKRLLSLFFSWEEIATFFSFLYLGASGFSDLRLWDLQQILCHTSVSQHWVSWFSIT